MFNRILLLCIIGIFVISDIMTMKTNKDLDDNQVSISKTVLMSTLTIMGVSAHQYLVGLEQSYKNVKPMSIKVRFNTNIDSVTDTMQQIQIPKDVASNVNTNKVVINDLPSDTLKLDSLEMMAVKINGYQFLKRTHQIEKELGIPHNSLLSVMWGESGFNHLSKVKYGSAGGLIGFLGKTQTGVLKLPLGQIYKMSALEQLEYVKLFYLSWSNKLHLVKSAEDLSILTFYPAALGKPDSYRFPNDVYLSNKPLDWNGDGILTLKDFRSYLKNHKRLRWTKFQS